MRVKSLLRVEWSSSKTNGDDKKEEKKTGVNSRFVDFYVDGWCYASSIENKMNRPTDRQTNRQEDRRQAYGIQDEKTK